MSPELRFCHWLKGYLDGVGIDPSGVTCGINAERVARIRNELSFATGDMVKLGRNEDNWIRSRPDDLISTRADEMMKMQLEANKHTQQTLACMGQTIPLAEQQRVEAEQTQQRFDPNYLAHVQRGNDLSRTRDPNGAVVNLGAGYGIPRGVR
jgi:hypothetical protein